MKPAYRISEKALKDLNEIWKYTLETWSQEQADRYYKLLISGIKYITQHFENGKSAEHIQKGYRYSKLKSHLIFYRKDENDIVEIIRVLHQRMDIENRFK
jgi:toxin ParE1/3/4